MKRPPVRYFRLKLARMTVGEIWRACEGNIVAFFVVLPSKIGLGIFTPPYAPAFKTACLAVDPLERFTPGLEVILAGIEAQRATTSAPER